MLKPAICARDARLRRRDVTKAMLVMKLTTLFLTIGFLNVYATGASQYVSFSGRNVPFESVFSAIEKQTDYVFMYSESALKFSKPVTINAQNVALQKFLQDIFASQPLDYSIQGKSIFVFPKETGSIAEQHALRETNNAPPDTLKTVKGRVVDKSGAPLRGVSIVLKSTATGVFSDADGNYTFTNLPANAVLQFSFVGMKVQEIPIGNRSVINVILELADTGLNEVIVTGYSTTAEKNVTSSVASADVASMQKKAVVDATQALQGNVSGVNITAIGGNPGEDMVINIRGLSSLSGETTPLVLVDGIQVEGGLRNINPNDIKSIQVLKDASSAAVYGSRAANGVILVSTKKGEQNMRARVNYSNYFSHQVPYKGISVTNSKQYISILQKMYGNDLSGADNAPQAALDYIADPSKFSDYNWQREIYRPAFMQGHDLSVSGGGPSGTYRISLGNVSQEGIALHAKYDRTNVRANSEFNVSNFIKIGQTFSYARSLHKTEPNAYGRGLFYHAIRMYPYFQPKDAEGNWQESDDYWGGGTDQSVVSGIRNPLAFINKLWDASSIENDLSMSGFAEITLLRGLTFRINGAYAQIDRSGWEKYAVKGEEFSDYYYSDDNSYSRNKDKSYNWNIDNLLRFQRKFGRHNVDVTLGYVAQKWYSDELGGYKWNFTSDQTSGLDAPGGMDPDTWSSSTEHGLLSYLSQAFYSYDDRYLLTVNFRRDGSSRFHPDYRWGNFPGVSVGWRLSREKLWQDLAVSNTITDLKIRAGYGILGRQNLGDYDYIATLENGYVVFDNEPQLSLITGNPVSYDTKWEELVSKTVGIDYELLRGKIRGSFDFYRNETRGMIIGVPISLAVGGGSRQGNLGEITNKGFEMTVDYRNKIGDLTYNVGFNLSTQKTTLVNFGTDLSTQEDEFGGDASNLPEWDVEHITELHKGGGLSEFWLIKTNGIFRTDEEAQEYVNKDGEMIQPFAKAGDIRFVDYNGDGEITAEGDRQYSGTGIPKVYAGLNITASYKQFDLYIGATGAFGQVIYNTTRYLTEQNHGFGNFSTALLNAFDPVTNTNSNIPRLNPNDLAENGNTRAATDRYMEKGDYVKIRNVELGYTLPQQMANVIKMSAARIFARVQNLANITKYTGPDPEIGGTPTNWQAHPSLYTAGIPRDFTPQARSYQVGVNITF